MEPAMKRSINDYLSVDCLVLLFEQFPLQQRMALRAVCVDWLDVIDHQMCGKCKSLKLFSTGTELKAYCLQAIRDNALCDEHLRLVRDDVLIARPNSSHDSEQFYRFLAELFRNVKHLTIHLSPDLTISLDEVANFIASLSKLTRLSLTGTIVSRDSEFLYSVIAKVSSFLKSLDLLATDPNIHLWIGTLERMNLYNVEHFSLRYESNSNLRDYLGRILCRLGPRCSELRLDLYQNLILELRQAIQSGSLDTLLTSVTSLRVKLTFEYENDRSDEIITLICDNFKELTKLDLQCSDMYESIKIDDKTICQLQKLTNLIELRLSCISLDLNQLARVQLPNITLVHLSQVTNWEGDDDSRIGIETSTDANLWHTVALLLPGLNELNIRVRRESIESIQHHVAQFFAQLTRASVIAAGSKVPLYFGPHHQRFYYNFPAKAYRIFESVQEIYFNLFKDL